MLRCTMTRALTFQRGLQDLLAELQLARAQGDLGKLALLCYCELRRWARDAGESTLADHCTGLITGRPHASRQAFLGDIDALISELTELQLKFALPLPPSPAPSLVTSESVQAAPFSGAIAS